MLNTLKVSIFILGCLSFYTTHAQKNFQPAYIIKQQGDTLLGYIDYRNWEENPDAIKFSSQINQEPTVLSPEDITEFGVQGEIYVSAIVYIMPGETTELNDSPDMHKQLVSVFLRSLVRGEKSLYYHDSPLGYQNFYIWQDSTYELLEYKKMVQIKNGQRVKVESKKYLTQLARYLGDCENIQQRLIGSKYGLNSLKKVFKSYYTCTQTTNSYLKEEEKTYTEIGALVGITSSSLSFEGNDFSYLTDVNYAPSTNASLAMFFDVVLPRNNRKWSINNELFYLPKHSISNSIQDIESENEYTYTDLELAYSYLKVNNMLRFKYPVRSLYIFLNAGISNGFAIHETNYKKTISRFYSRETIKEEELLDSPRKHEQAFLLGAGLKYHKLSFELRYEKGNGMSPYSYLNSKTQRIHFLLGYKILN